MNESEKAILKNISILRLLPTETQTKLIKKFEEKDYKFGDVIVREGDPADVFYLLTSGRARVLTQTDDGREIPLKTLYAGDCFGEMGLLLSGKRTKTVRASSEVTTMGLSGHDFNEIISGNSNVRDYFNMLIRYRNLENFLREFTSLGKIPSNALQFILKQLELVNFQMGDVIIKEGSEPGPMYIIETGRCRVIRNDNKGGKKIAYLRHGEIFGELSLLQNSPRVATVEAVTDCTLMSLSPAAFRSILHKYPFLNDIVEKRISQYYSGKESNRLPLDFAQIMEESQQIDHHSKNDRPFHSTDHPQILDSGQLDFTPDDSIDKKKLRKKTKFPRRFPLLRQIDESDCGAAALGMICHFFGLKVTLAHVRELSNTGVDGTTLKDLCKASIEMGLNGRAVKLSRRNLDFIPTPTIIHWQNNHWIVLIKQKKKILQIADPASHISWISRDQFERNWSGYAILFDNVNPAVFVPESRGIFHWILPHLKFLMRPVSNTLLISIVIIGLQLLFPILTQIIVDDVILVKNPDNLNLFVTSLGLVLVATLLLTMLQQHLLSYISVHLDGVISTVIINKLLALPILYFNKRSPDDVQRRLEGARDVKHFIVYRVINGLIALFQLIAFVFLMAFYNGKMTLIFFILIPIYLGLMFFSAKVLKPAFDDLQISESKYGILQKDIIKGIHVIKAAGTEAIFKKKILNDFADLAKNQGQSNFNIFCYQGTINALGFLSTIIFIWVGARLVLLDQLTLGRFIAFQMLIAMSYSPILTLLNAWQDLQQSSVLINRLNDIIICSPEQPHNKVVREVTTLQGRVEFKNVNFTYSGGGSTKVLNRISLTAIPGQLIAIVGKSGAGKSSLVKCIASLLKPIEGEILYDDITSGTLNLSTLRQHIGLVTQDEYLFSGSVIENIALGDPNPDIERVVRAAQSANAHKFILELPNEYHTTISDVPLQLSRGQMQSIAIARMIYRDPPILILDEATSTMDLESEATILSNLEKIRSGRLLFIVTHRLQTVIHAEIILVMEKGHIVERGNHEELIARRGLYHQLFTTQYA